MSIPRITLNNGLKMPVLGLGTWKSKPGQVENAVGDAIDCGYRHIDCAYVYVNEKEVGDGIKKKLDEGIVKREDLWITSKLWNTFHRPDMVEEGLRETLDNLGLDYLDLFLIHWPYAYQEGKNISPTDANGKRIYSDVHYCDTWKAMEICLEKGLTRTIGLANFNHTQIKDILKICKIKPAVLQVECHPYWPQIQLSEFCTQNGIHMMAYSPLGSPDRPWAKPEEPQPLNDSKIINLAEKYGKSGAQILIRYQIQRNHSVIPKSVTKSRIQSNIQIFDFELTDDDMTVLSNLGNRIRFCHQNWVDDHQYYPFKAEY